jgi:hypothetical protein
MKERKSKEKVDQYTKQCGRRQTTRNRQYTKERQTPEDQQLVIEGRRQTPEYDHS